MTIRQCAGIFLLLLPFAGVAYLRRDEIDWKWIASTSLSGFLFMAWLAGGIWLIFGGGP